MRKINEIIIHCSATPYCRDVTVADIDRYHRSRGWEGIGYHFVVYRDGSVHSGRDLSRPGAHCSGHNASSIGVCYIGGLDANGQPADTRTPQQRNALTSLLHTLVATYPGCTIHGHRDFAPKACPCFDATAEYAYICRGGSPASTGLGKCLCFIAAIVSALSLLACSSTTATSSHTDTHATVAGGASASWAQNDSLRMDLDIHQMRRIMTHDSVRRDFDIDIDSPMIFFAHTDSGKNIHLGARSIRLHYNSNRVSDNSARLIAEATATSTFTAHTDAASHSAQSASYDAVRHTSSRKKSTSPLPVIVAIVVAALMALFICLRHRLRAIWKAI